MEKAPAGLTGSFSMLSVMVFRRFHEKFSFDIFFPLQNPILFAYTRCLVRSAHLALSPKRFAALVDFAAFNRY